METRKFKISRSSKQLLIAASAVVTMGIGTTLKHELVVKADTTSDTSTTVSDSTATSTPNTKSIDPSTPTSTSSSDTSNTSTLTVTKVATPLITPVAQSVPVAETVTPATSTVSSSTVPATSATETPSTASTQVSTQSTQTPATTAPTTTAPATTTPATTGATATTSGAIASTANDFLWNTDDTNLTATVTGINGTYTSVVIPSTVNLNSKDYDVTAIGDNAFVGNNSITSVTINNGVKTIGNGAFAYINNLSSVDLSNNTTLTTIGDDAFTSSKVTSVDLPSSVTSIGDDAFAYNSDLSSVNLGSNLTSIGKEAFASDSKLTTISLPSTLQTIGDAAFTSDTGITSIDFGTDSKLTSIGNSAFAYNVALQDLTIPDSVVTIGDNAFVSNVDLKSVELGSGLTSIGDGAFLYDGDLTNLDLSHATDLNTIGTGAFEYDGVTGELNFPDSVSSIGNLAFTGDKVDGVTFGSGLKTIGNNAFAFNHISDSVEIPAATTSIGAQSFLGNQIESIKLNGSNTNVQDSAFKYNRIVDVSAPQFTISGMPASNQTTTIFTDTTHDSISDLFNLQADGFTEQNLNVSNLTNGVTYAYTDGTGKFNIPTGTNSFTFDWNMTNGYNGQYTVVLNNPDIKAVGSQIVAGSDWTPQDNLVSAQLQNGTTLQLSDLKVAVKDQDGNAVDTVNTTKPGQYTVTYSYGNDSTSVVVSVLKVDGTYEIVGSSSNDYNGENQTPDISNYAVSLSDGTSYKLQSGDIAIDGTDSKDAGSYKVVLTQQGIDNLDKLSQSDIYNWVSGDSIATYTINKANVTIKVNDASKIAGQPDPVLTATVSGPTGLNESDLQYTVERVAGDTVGIYPVSISYNANPNYNVTVSDGTFEILPATLTLTGSDYTMHVGDATPTTADFQATATDDNDQPITVMVDLSKVDLSKAGDYGVVLSTADGQSKTVTLHVLANATTPTTPVTPPTTPTKPVTPPTTPTKPVTPPTTPTKPVTPPTTPTKPVTPPTTPTKPVTPPTTPTKPLTPPTTPTKPVTPPTTPTKPVTPPTTPTTPVTPPSKPTIPDTPVEPDEPGTPEVIVKPTDNSKKPSTVATTTKPVVPVTHGKAEAPTNSSVVGTKTNNVAEPLTYKSPVSSNSITSKDVVVLSGNKQVVLPVVSKNTSQGYPAQTGRFPQTSSTNGRSTSIVGIVIAVLGLLGIDIKRRKA
ncbi:leucine-rich repeat protein [Companilactobacillus hulinensis]|uniref:leucine-rich repeat protein n=1 Tax=Companilactobacillus hulinensis TaxID=2486007 RepID=UPI000F78E2F8|nr:leucine-rich repeat protein [Companilactobacillus hulinensis]